MTNGMVPGISARYFAIGCFDFAGHLRSAGVGFQAKPAEQTGPAITRDDIAIA